MAKTITEPFALTCKVGEVTDTVGHIVKVDENRMKRIFEADPDPHPAKFVTIEVEGGWSANKRHFGNKVMESIAQQINAKEPLGYKGHPMLKKEFDVGADFPDPQTIWLGATTLMDGNSIRMVAKGYNLTEEIRRQLQVGAVNSVSVCGDATMVATKGGYEVEDFNVETLDWSRKGAQGMKGRVTSLTGEQEKNERRRQVDAAEIAALSENELRLHNPTLVKNIEDSASKKATEPLEAKIGEQEAVVDLAKPSVDAVAEIRKLLNLEEKDSITQAVTELLVKSRGALKAEYDKAVEKVLGKIEDEDIRGLVRGLVGEMASDVNTEEEAAEAGEKRANEILDTNDHVKKLVGEMKDDDGKGGLPAHRPEGEGGKKKSSLVIEEVSA